MHTIRKKILATTLAIVGAAGAHTGQELFVENGIENGKAIVVAAPLGRCTLKQVFVDGENTFVNVRVASDATPSGLHVITVNGDVPVAMGDTGKGGPGMSMVGGTFPASELLSPAPINPATPVGAVIADTLDGRVYCGSFIVVPYAGNGNKGQTVG